MWCVQRRCDGGQVEWVHVCVCWMASVRLVSGGVLQAISAGTWHTCGIVAATRAAMCWGHNDYGQTDVPTGGDTGDGWLVRGHACEGQAELHGRGEALWGGRRWRRPQCSRCVCDGGDVGCESRMASWARA